MVSLLASTPPQYSASAEEREMALCILQYQVIGHEPRVNTYPTVDFRSSGSPTQSESVKPIKNGDAPAL